MKFCKRCGKKISSNTAFCPNCGFDQSASMSSVGYSNRQSNYLRKPHMDTVAVVCIVIILAIFGLPVLFVLLGMILPPLVQLLQ